MTMIQLQRGSRSNLGAVAWQARKLMQTLDEMQLALPAALMSRVVDVLEDEKKRDETEARRCEDGGLVSH